MNLYFPAALVITLTTVILFPLMTYAETDDEVKRISFHSRVYITGNSYGGFGTWYMAENHPGRDICEWLLSHSR